MKFVYILAAILIFGVLIFVHELGHFAAAKLFGVKVNEFSMGMGPEIWSWQGKETQYSLRALPVGGFCAMEGEDADTGDDRSLFRQRRWKQLIILAAGAFMNLLTGVFIVAILYCNAAGFYVDKISGFAEGFSLEGENGLMLEDIIYKIDGYRTYLAGDTSLFLQYNDGKGVDIEVIRNGEHIVLKNFPMYRGTYEGQEHRFGLSVGRELIPATPLVKIQYIYYQTLDFVQMVWFSLVQLVRGNVGLQEMGGPVMIVDTIVEVGTHSETFSAAMWRIAYMGALIAVNLAVMNMLPVPALDGGRIFFLILDAITLAIFHRKVPEKYQMAVNAVGFVLLMGFMLLITVKDVFQLFH